jgi:hypothetical protein
LKNSYVAEVPKPKAAPVIRKVKTTKSVPVMKPKKTYGKFLESLFSEDGYPAPSGDIFCKATDKDVLVCVFNESTLT